MFVPQPRAPLCAPTKRTGARFVRRLVRWSQPLGRNHVRSQNHLWLERRGRTAERVSVRPSVVVARQYPRRDWLLRRLLAGSDCLAITMSLALAGALVGRPDLERFVVLGVLVIPAWLVLIRAYGLYDRDQKRINCSTIDDIPGIFHSLFIGSVLLWGYFRLLPVKRFALIELLIFATAAAVTILLGRAAVRSQMRARGERRAVIVGEGINANLLVRKLASHREYGVRLVGSLSMTVPGSPDRLTSGYEDDPLGPSLPVLGTLADVNRVALEHSLDRVIVASNGVEEAELMELLRRCRQSGLRLSLLPQIFDVMGPSVEIDDVEGVTVLGLNPPVLSRSSRALKRGMDLLGSIVALVLTAPLLVIISAAIKLGSPGPVFFVQSRVGRGGRKLRVYKFRTMVRDAEAQRERLASLSTDPHWLKLESDPRITGVGRLLRLSSLDELPQLLNVLKGEMSLVGPRPLIQAESDLVVDWARARLDLTPGVTGLWQVLGRTSIPFEEMVKLDYLYVTNWSLWSDARLLMRTLPAVLSRRGAN
jgi:exopolysaccharide biosynthesis polyprenyl glycosylphosphotransferase